MIGLYTGTRSPKWRRKNMYSLNPGSELPVGRWTRKTLKPHYITESQSRSILNSDLGFRYTVNPVPLPVCRSNFFFWTSRLLFIFIGSQLKSLLISNVVFLPFSHKR